MLILAFKLFFKKSKSILQLLPFCSDFHLFFAFYNFVSLSQFSVNVERSKLFIRYTK